MAQNKIDWYNENGLHSQVLEALYPVIVSNLITDQGQALNKKQKEGDGNQVIHSKIYGIC